MLTTTKGQDVVPPQGEHLNSKNESISVSEASASDDGAPELGGGRTENNEGKSELQTYFRFCLYSNHDCDR